MNAFIERLGWMLLHSLWEGAVVWLLLQVALIVFQKKSAQARYVVSCLALVVMALLPWMTFGSMDLSARLQRAPMSSDPAFAHSEAVFSPANSAVSPNIASSSGPSYSTKAVILPADEKSLLRAFLPWLVSGWILGVMLFSLRLWFSWHSVRRLASLPLPLLSAVWQRRLADLCRKAGVRRVVRAGETAAVVVPLVVGWLRPVILLPLGVFAQLPIEQVEAILLHELAHIRRHDFAVNLLQSVVETLFFYHPAVRSINRRIRDERERVCDDLSVEWCQNPVAYAEALTTFEEFRRQSLALAATGEGDLLARVRRIVLGVEPQQRTVTIFAIAGILATGVYLTSMFLAPLLASSLMTDKERVEAIQALQLPSQDTFSTPGAAPQIRLTGNLSTEDNQPLPFSLRESRNDSKVPSEALVVSHYGNCSMTSSLYFDGKSSFYCSPISGLVSLGIWAEGYAPLLLDHLEIKNKAIGPLSLVLKRGFPARLRIITPDGKPLEGVTLSASTRAMTRFPEVGMPPVLTDADGQACIGNVEADTILTVGANKAGWQRTEKSLGDWSPDHVISWALQPAVITSGTIIDQVSHKPVQAATIMLASQGGSDPQQPQTYSPINAPILGHGDMAGNFKLDSLNPDYSYNVYVKAPGYPPTVLPIQAGDHGIKLTLPPGLRVEGRILDPKGVVSTLYRPIILCQISINADAYHSYGYELPAQKLSKLGSDLRFTFDDLPAGKTDFMVNSQWYPLQLEHDVDNFVIDLGKAPPADDTVRPMPSRPVRITFKSGKDHPSPLGNLNTLYNYYGGDSKDRPNNIPKSVPITNGQAIIEIPAPNKLTLFSSGLAGYWFKQQVVDLPAGAGPVEKTIDVIAAGAISGKVTGETNLRDLLFTCTPMWIKAAPGLKGTDLGGSYPEIQNSGHYLTSPLPLGGTYAVILKHGSNTYTVSAPISINADHPVVNLDLEVKASGTLRGRFLDQNNKPVGLESVSLRYVPDSETLLPPSVAARTARDGTFTIPNMNFDVPGHYEISLTSFNWSQDSMPIVDGHTPQPLTLLARHK